jgi:D-sedoheptulose 7-phosphate isomerase
MDGECDVLVNVPSDKTNKIQEMHIIVGHFICGKVETKLFP